MNMKPDCDCKDAVKGVAQLNIRYIKCITKGVEFQEWVGMLNTSVLLKSPVDINMLAPADLAFNLQMRLLIAPLTQLSVAAVPINACLRPDRPMSICERTLTCSQCEWGGSRRRELTARTWPWWPRCRQSP